MREIQDAAKHFYGDADARGNKAPGGAGNGSRAGAAIDRAGGDCTQANRCSHRERDAPRKTPSPNLSQRRYSLACGASIPASGERNADGPVKPMLDNWSALFVR